MLFDYSSIFIFKTATKTSLSYVRMHASCIELRYPKILIEPRESWEYFAEKRKII